MQTSVTFKNIDPSDHLKAYVSDKLDRFDKFLDNPAEAGKFRVPSLRNVAVTAPYMHNGLFQNLETAVAFYAKYTLRDHRNPETGALWRPAEIPESVDLEILAGGQPIHPARIQHPTAFLKTLTDRRYEHLLD